MNLLWLWRKKMYFILDKFCKIFSTGKILLFIFFLWIWQKHAPHPEHTVSEEPRVADTCLSEIEIPSFYYWEHSRGGNRSKGLMLKSCESVSCCRFSVSLVTWCLCSCSAEKHAGFCFKNSFHSDRLSDYFCNCLANSNVLMAAV